MLTLQERRTPKAHTHSHTHTHTLTHTHTHSHTYTHIHIHTHTLTHTTHIHTTHFVSVHCKQRHCLQHCCTVPTAPTTHSHYAVCRSSFTAKHTHTHTHTHIYTRTHHQTWRYVTYLLVRSAGCHVRRPAAPNHLLTHSCHGSKQHHHPTPSALPLLALRGSDKQ